MGFLKKTARALGKLDTDLIERGLLARGKVVACRRTGWTVGVQVKSVVCELTVEVELEDRPVYTAECKHPVQMPYLPQFESGQAYFAVRVDPDDHTNIALDTAHDVPPPRGQDADAPQSIVEAGDLSADVAAQLAAAGLGSAETSQPPPNRVSAVSGAEILATGLPCRAIVQSAQPLGFQKEGKDVWGIVLNAVAEGAAPFSARIGLGVPPEAVSLLFPGADLPAKYRSDVPDGVCIDWDAALAARD